MGGHKERDGEHPRCGAGGMCIPVVSGYIVVYEPDMGMGQNPGTPGEHQHSWQMDVHPTKNVSIGIDPY
jgi:hypothetical protein